MTDAHVDGNDGRRLADGEAPPAPGLPRGDQIPARRNSVRRGVNSALFGLIFPCFFLPFTTVLDTCTATDSPGDEVDITFTGWDLVTTPTIRMGDVRTGTEVITRGHQPSAIAVLVVAALGATLGRLRRLWGPIVAILLGLGGAYLLAATLASVTLFGEATVEPGFLLAEGLFLSAAGWGVYRLVSELVARRRRALPERAPPRSPPHALDATPAPPRG